MGKYVLGMDGGGTKTAVAAAAPDGTLLGRFVSGAINPNGENQQNVTRNLAEIFSRAKMEFGSLDECDSVCIGAAGISNPTVKQMFLSVADDAGYHHRMTITGDHQTAFYGALGKPDGAILISGTGSICYGKNSAGQEHRTGGYGHLIDDAGSGYAIGRDILSAVVRAYDGRGGTTVLTELVFQQLGCSTIEELVGFVYDKATNKRDIAALAPNLTKACDRKDRVALHIAADSAIALEELAIPVLETLGLQNSSLAIAGSILLKNPTIQQEFLRCVRLRYPKLECHTPKYDAAYGAVLIALEALQELTE